MRELGGERMHFSERGKGKSVAFAAKALAYPTAFSSGLT